MKNFLKLFKQYKFMTFMAPLLKMIEAIFELLVPFIIKDIIDTTIPSALTKRLVLQILLLLLLGGLGLLVSITAQYMSAKVATSISHDLKIELFKKLQSLSYEDIDVLGEDALVTKLTSDANQIQNGVNMFLRLFLRSPFIVIGAIIMSLIINLKLGLIFVVSIPVIFIFVLFIILKSISKFKKLQEKNQKTLKRTKDNVTGIKIVTSFTNEDTEIKENNEEITDYYKYQNKISFFTSLMSPITYAIINLAIILIVYIGANMLEQDLILKGDIVALYNYMSQVLIEIIKLANLSILLSKTLASISRYNSFIKLETKQKYVPESNLKENNTDTIIECNNVSFKYVSNKTNTLDNINLKINKGEFIGIVGQTGCGKSTLINLFNRNYDATKGEILINNNNINDYSKADLKDFVLITNNNFFFLEDTIKENICMNNTCEDSKLDEAISMSLSKDIVSKKGGKEAKILENGKNLSGGEKERIQIARALVSKASVLIFDASLEALDANSFNSVVTNLRSLNKTIIIATERINQIKDADKIIVLDNHTITGFDNHENLLKTNNHYKEMYMLNSLEGI